MTVDGANSTWTNSGNLLIVGQNGTGTLAISNGGSVSAPTMFIAVQAGSTGTLNIGAAAGQAAAAPGTLSAASVNLGSGNGQIVFNHTGANYTFAPVIIGSGAGTRTVRVEAGTAILTRPAPIPAHRGQRAARCRSTGRSPVGDDRQRRRHARRQRHRRQHRDRRGRAGAREFDRVADGAGQPRVHGGRDLWSKFRPSNAGRTNVTGTATLGSATVNAGFAAGSYIARQYTIVNATGGVSGSTFGARSAPICRQNSKPTLSYDANNAYLNLALNFVPPPGSGLNSNQQNVANAITGFFNRTGGIPLVFRRAESGRPDPSLR